MDMDLVKKYDKYQKLEMIGEGTYGVVYKVKDIKSNKLFAIKKIRLQVDEEGTPSTAIREISLLMELNHVNIVKLVDVIHTNTKLTLVFEYLDTDLKKLMTLKENVLNESTIKSFLYQLLRGVHYIHKKKILHRDLKPQNLLISEENILKIADFGLARSFSVSSKNYTHEVITLWYRPPDVLIGCKNYDINIDMWSIGCIFVEMLLGYPIFSGSSEAEQVIEILKVIGIPSYEDYPEFRTYPEYKEEMENYTEFNLFKILKDKCNSKSYDLLSVSELFIIKRKC